MSKRLLVKFLLWIGVISVVMYTVWNNSLNDFPRPRIQSSLANVTVSYDSPSDFDHFDNVSGAPGGCTIVPNYVHFIRFNKPEFTFVDAVCVLAAFKNQKPDKIFFHTNSPSFHGKYWEELISKPDFKTVLDIQYLPIPTQIYGQKLNKGWLVYHGGDVARLQVLMKYGGIFLDNDSYIVKSLDQFRKYELAIGWKEGGNISNQVIIAHKNARFLREWMESYRDAYRPSSWFYNAGIRPTQEVLIKKPYLVHRVPTLLAEYHGMVNVIYLSHSGSWRNHWAIHLLIGHQYMINRNLSSKATYPVVFDENNIKNYDVNFKDMVADVYPLT